MKCGRGRGTLRTVALLGTFLISLSSVSMAPALAGDDDDDSSGSWADRIGDSVKNTFGSVSKSVGLSKPTPPPAPESLSGCPTISVLDGTEAQRVMVSNKTGNDGLRYQYSIYNVGRECSMTGGRVAIKVGAAGRVLLGPAGAAGHFDVPVRVAIFNLVDQKPVVSKLYRVSVSIPTGQSAASFQFVSDSLVVPVAAGRTAMDYSIKVGIDGAGSASGAAPKASRHHAPKPTQSASQ